MYPLARQYYILAINIYFVDMFVKDFTYKMRPISCIDIDITSILEAFENIEVKLAKVWKYIQHTLLAGYRAGWWFVAIAILQTDILFHQLDGAWGECRWWWWPCGVFQTKVTRRCSSSWCRVTPSSSTPLRWSLTSSNLSREYSSILSCSHSSRWVVSSIAKL